MSDPQVCVECFYPHGHHAVSCERQMSPAEWWAQAKATADAYVAAHPVRPCRCRMDARSEAMSHIITRAREHPRARELLKLIYDAGWNI